MSIKDANDFREIKECVKIALVDLDATLGGIESGDLSVSVSNWRIVLCSVFSNLEHIGEICDSNLTRLAGGK